MNLAMFSSLDFADWWMIFATFACVMVAWVACVAVWKVYGVAVDIFNLLIDIYERTAGGK